MTNDDPNEAYEVVPIAQTGRGPPDSWWKRALADFLSDLSKEEKGSSK
jgi:hypothetical protein